MQNSNLKSSICWRVGTCGISDSDWIGNFYSRGLRTIDRLGYYAERFNAIELNTTFHAIPRREYVKRWTDVTPPNFRFSVKFLKEVTHGPSDYLVAAQTLETAKRFFDVIQELGEKLAIVFMLFPPWFSAIHRPTLLQLLDRISCPARLVIEFRNDSWWTPTTANALRERNIGWVAADLGSFPLVAEVPVKGRLLPFGLRPIISTTDFLYARWLGKHLQFPEHTEERFDSTPRVAWWLERLMHVTKSYPNIRDVYAFFDNDFSGHAPTAARRFADKVNLRCGSEVPLKVGQPSPCGRNQFLWE